MAVFSARKRALLKFFASLLPATAAGVLLCKMLAGPVLLPYYDVLLRLRPPLTVSPGILIIDASRHEDLNSVLEPRTAASVLITLTEMKAGSLIIQTPVLGLSAPSPQGDEEILARFDEEFALLGGNIRGLFDGIRLGSVGPAEATGFVSELVELTEGGKERLISAYLRQHQEGALQLKQAASLFGAVFQPAYLTVQVIRGGEPVQEKAQGGALPGGNTDEYFRARPDRDGVLRRIAPFIMGGEAPAEHIVYRALKGEFESSEAVYTERGWELQNRKADGSLISIALDDGGAIIVEKPQVSGDFRRLSLSSFLDYEDKDKNLRRLLGDAEALGIYQNIPGERNPLILYDYALSLEEDLLQNHGEEGEGAEGTPVSTWITGRNNYFRSLDSFLYGPEEMGLVEKCEVALADTALSEEKKAVIRETRDSIIRTFVRLREKYNELLDLRKDLGAGLAGSFCILGPDNMDTEASCLLANSLLTGAAVTPWPFLYNAAAAAFWALLTSLFLCSMGAMKSLLAGGILSLLGGLLFALVFVFSGFWFDPLPPMAAAVAGTLVSSLYAFVLKAAERRRFRLAYGPFISPLYLKEVINHGRPAPEEMLRAWAAIAAVRNPQYSSPEPAAGAAAGRDKAQAILEFQRHTVEHFLKAGGTLVGCEGDMVLVCFGSPLERSALNRKKTSSPYGDAVHGKSLPVLKAWAAMSDLLKQPGSAYWYFALDVGECSFACSRFSGYSAFGLPVVRARILAGLAPRYKAAVIISSRASELLPDLPVRKLDMLRAGDTPEAFYEPVM